MQLFSGTRLIATIAGIVYALIGFALAGEARGLRLWVVAILSPPV